MSGWCQNDKNVSKRFIDGVQRIFCRHFTGDRKISLKYQELETFYRISVSVGLLLGICKVFYWVPEKVKISR